MTTTGGMAPAGPVDLDYQPSTAGIDTGSYNLAHADSFRDDPVAQAGIDDLARLYASPHWEDRVRAELLRRRVQVTLPDQFPCIYERPDSPNNARSPKRPPFVWVVSPDIDMLARLLPDYQDLWDSYTSQWGPSSRRVFAVGRLDGLQPHRVYRPRTTPGQVMGSTMLTHEGMYGRAAERLRRMHPMYSVWQADRRIATT